MSKTHVNPAFVAVTAVAGLAAALALALIAAPAAHSGTPSGPDCLLTNTGGSLDDSLCGTSGANVMTGGAGNDTMFGRGGNDTMNGQTGGDHVHGEGGNDIVSGGSGADTVLGDSGSDQVQVRDGTLDTFSCGSGADSLDADLVDVGFSVVFQVSILFLVVPSCETVTVGAVNEGPNVVISRHTPKIKDNGKVPLRLSCPAELTVPCAGTLTLGRSENSLGAPKAYGIGPGTSQKVSARLSRRDRRKLSRRGEITVRAGSIEQGEFGDKTTGQTLTLTARD